jgi:hypothetical protein
MTLSPSSSRTWRRETSSSTVVTLTTPTRSEGPRSSTRRACTLSVPVSRVVRRVRGMDRR